MDIQDQIYVVSGALGAASVILFILVIVLFVLISKLKKKEANDGYGTRAVGSKDLLEKRGFSEYKGADVPHSFVAPTQQSHLARQFSTNQQHSNTGMNSYQQQPINLGPPSVVKGPPPSAYPNVPGGYGKAYDNLSYEREQQREQRDITAGGVRVLPTGGDQARRNNYENSGYY